MRRDLWDECVDLQHPSSLFRPSAGSYRLDNACIMAVRRDGMTIANVNSFLEMSGADREAGEIVNAAGIKISDPVQEPGYGRWVSTVPHMHAMVHLPKNAGTKADVYHESGGRPLHVRAGTCTPAVSCRRYEVHPYGTHRKITSVIHRCEHIEGSQCIFFFRKLIESFFIDKEDCTLWTTITPVERLRAVTPR